jgi:tetratricopeptide (TPR) repeat protein
VVIEMSSSSDEKKDMKLNKELRKKPIKVLIPALRKKTKNVITLTFKNTAKTNRTIYKWTSKESLIVLSLIFIFIIAIIELLFSNVWSKVNFAFQLLSGMIFLIFMIIAIFGAYLLYLDRARIRSHEFEGILFFISGSIFTIVLPIIGVFSNQDPVIFLNNYSWLMYTGIIFIIIGTILTAWFDGFYSVWFFGLIHYILMSSHEAYPIYIYTHHFGPYDQYYGSLGLFLILTSAILFAYHELKYLYLGKLIKRASDQRSLGFYKGAMMTLNKILKIHPRYATAWNNWGNILYRLGRFEDAIICYDRALELAPDYWVAIKNKHLVQKRKIKLLAGTGLYKF